MKRNCINIRIWHLINNPAPERGGAQKILAKLVGPNEEVLSIQPNSYAFIKFLPNILTTLISVAFKIKRAKPEIIYIHSRCFLPLSWLIKSVGGKAVFYAHASYRKHLWLYKTFPCDHYIAVSESVKKKLLEHGVIEKIVSTIPNPYIGETHVGTYPSPIEKRLKIGFVGSLNSWKGIIEAINSIYEISSKIKGGISFNIVGDGPLMSKIQKLKYTAPKNVDILISGHQEMPFKVLEDSHALLIPSLEEGFGLVAIEGIYQGKILIYNAIPALREICDNDPLSFSFDIRRSSSLLSAINKAIDSIGSIDDIALSQNRSELVEKKYGLENFTEKHRSLRETTLIQKHQN
ncbi:glycosyltransferase family 4 protein [Pseudomonas sp. YH-1]|uniref:glycosyltransferase family 4 protein n=1 Tax=Pseudomonas sp. YH-1 TaxID=3384787 RepID=UPI003F7E285A